MKKVLFLDDTSIIILIEVFNLKEQKSFLRDFLEVIVASLILFLLLNNYVADAREIPSGSMIPTIKIGDRLMVEKVSLHFTDIKRGDIVVFSPPPNINVKDDLIKRVIGLPGDIVEVKPGVGVYVNGKKLDEPYVNEVARSGIEPGSSNGAIVNSSNPNSIAVKVPPNNYFMMGDNRNNSYDSRWWGTISRDKIKGKAVFIFFPFKDIGALKK